MRIYLHLDRFYKMLQKLFKKNSSTKTSAKIAFAILVLAVLQACDSKIEPQILISGHVSKNSNPQYLECSLRVIVRDDVPRYKTEKDAYLNLSTEDEIIWGSELRSAKSAIREFKSLVEPLETEGVTLNGLSQEKIAEKEISVLEAQRFLIDSLVQFRTQIMHDPDRRHRLLVVLPEVSEELSASDSLLSQIRSNNLQIQKDLELLQQYLDKIDMMRFAGGEKWLDRGYLHEFREKAGTIRLSKAGECT
jgi:hypothetical protein